MKNQIIYLTLLFAAFIPITSSADSSTLTASIRIGLTFEDDGTTDELFFRNFGSRLKWNGTKELDNGWTGIGYAELGLNPDNNSRGSSGIDETRQLWAGLTGGFGSLKLGAQYAAFYDMVSAHTDIAWWGSCWTQFECGRKTRVLKYSGSAAGLSIAASVVAAAGDEDNDFADQIEVGANYTFGKYKVGVAGSQTTDEGVVDGGTLVGVMLGGTFGAAELTLTHQDADSDFAQSAAEVTNTTIAGTLGPIYVIYNVTDNGSSSDPFYATLGYTWTITDSTLMYFEAQTNDPDTDVDAETIIRATYKLDF